MESYPGLLHTVQIQLYSSDGFGAIVYAGPLFPFAFLLFFRVSADLRVGAARTALAS